MNTNDNKRREGKGGNQQVGWMVVLGFFCFCFLSQRFGPIMCCTILFYVVSVLRREERGNSSYAPEYPRQGVDLSLGPGPLWA